MSTTMLLVLVIVIVLVFGGGWYGHREWGPRGGLGIVGAVLLFLLLLYLIGVVRL